MDSMEAPGLDMAGNPSEPKTSSDSLNLPKNIPPELMWQLRRVEDPRYQHLRMQIYHKYNVMETRPSAKQPQTRLHEWRLSHSEELLTVQEYVPPNFADRELTKGRLIVVAISKSLRIPTIIGAPKDRKDRQFCLWRGVDDGFDFSNGVIVKHPPWMSPQKAMADWSKAAPKRKRMDDHSKDEAVDQSDTIHATAPQAPRRYQGATASAVLPTLLVARHEAVSSRDYTRTTGNNADSDEDGPPIRRRRRRGLRYSIASRILESPRSTRAVYPRYALRHDSPGSLSEEVDIAHRRLSGSPPRTTTGTPQYIAPQSPPDPSLACQTSAQGDPPTSQTVHTESPRFNRQQSPVWAQARRKTPPTLISVEVQRTTAAASEHVEAQDTICIPSTARQSVPDEIRETPAAAPTDTPFPTPISEKPFENRHKPPVPVIDLCSNEEERTVKPEPDGPTDPNTMSVLFYDSEGILSRKTVTYAKCHNIEQFFNYAVAARIIESSRVSIPLSITFSTDGSWNVALTKWDDESELMELKTKLQALCRLGWRGALEVRAL